MRPIYLSFKAFGPYVEKQEIDFTQLAKNGLFLISGETGAGKTAVLDAMVYALYGESSTNTRGDISAMRCQLAQNDNPTELEFVFKLRGCKYKFTRTIKYGRKNFTASQNAMREINGVYVPFFENPRFVDVKMKAEELLGLNYEQFRQVIILPQGQFERLLLAKSDEKEKILVSLFGVGNYSRAADILKTKVLEEQDLLERAKAAVDAIIQSFGVDSLEELEALYKNKLLIKKELVEKDKTQTKEYNLRKTEYDDAIVLNQRFEQLDFAQKAVQALKEKEAQMKELSEKLASAARAENVREKYAETQAAFNEYDIRNKEMQKTSIILEDISKKHEGFLKAFQTLKDQEIINYENKQKYLTLTEKIKPYEELSVAQIALEQAVSDEKKETQKTKEVKENAERASKKCLEVQHMLSDSQQSYQKLLNAYISGISGTLAQKLKSGEPCPVCGSKSHPAPASISTFVTQVELEEAREKADEYAKAYELAAKEALAAAAEFSKQDKRSNAAQLEMARANARTDSIKQSCVESIESLAQLNEIILKLKENVDNYEKDLLQKQKNLEESALQLKSKTAELIFQKKECENAQAKFNAEKSEYQKKLSANGFDDTKQYLAVAMDKQARENGIRELTEYKANLSAKENDVKTQTAHLFCKARPDTKSLSETLEKCEKARVKTSNELAVCERETKELEVALAKANKDLAYYEKKIAENRDNLTFAKRLRGDNGISLQRYVLGVMLNIVVLEANRLLERVHGGRYVLYRTLEASGSSRKAGLELEVLDRNSGIKRNVSTLSGGEKFLAALSLSIGLSAAVQAQSAGISLGAMFIDEGFGSLDPASINDALNVLSEVNTAKGIVGIISHVESMKENISSKILVIKDNKGSKLKVIT